MTDRDKQCTPENRLLAELELLKRVHHAQVSTGTCIAELRRIHSMSKIDLAKRAKISTKTLSAIESDDDEISIRAVMQALSVFQFRLATLPFESLPEWMEERLSRAGADKDKLETDPRWNRHEDIEYWRHRRIQLDDLKFLFPEEGD